MEKKTLKYSVHVHGELEEGISCPMGKYYVDVEHKLFFFEPKEDLDPHSAEITAAVVALIAAHRFDVARAMANIHKYFEKLPSKYVEKKDDKYIYDFHIDGEMEEFVTHDEYGTLYGDHEKNTFFFDCKHKGFMTPILKKKFFDGIEKDLKDDDEETRVGAEAVMEICENWVELDEEDIIR